MTCKNYTYGIVNQIKVTSKFVQYILIDILKLKNWNKVKIFIFHIQEKSLLDFSFRNRYIPPIIINKEPIKLK